MNKLLETAIKEFDRVNGEDLRQQTVGRKSYARELIFARKVYAWVERLDPSAPEDIRLAARSHTLRRWEIPRNRYRMDIGGYHQWRAATSTLAADAAAEILKRVGYSDAIVREVKRIITGHRHPSDPDTQLLEDADVLAFLEIKLEDYLARWDETKVQRILEGAWSKMSAAARRLALDLPLDSRVKKLIASLT
ncbi:MAG: DUF4202 domain-containing protein [Nitrospirae bacterium]|nr:DUF4202 domain-containing protein [Nitrospirota bacterium]